MPATQSAHARFRFTALRDLTVAGFANHGDGERATFALRAGQSRTIDLVHWICSSDGAHCDYAIYHPSRVHEISSVAGLYCLERVVEQ
jgi:hypothetical protein